MLNHFTESREATALDGKIDNLIMEIAIYDLLKNKKRGEEAEIVMAENGVVARGKPHGKFFSYGITKRVIIINQGKKNWTHRRHTFEELARDSEKYGDNLTDMDHTFATYKYHYRCKCGAERLVETRAFI